MVFHFLYQIFFEFPGNSRDGNITITDRTDTGKIITWNRRSLCGKNIPIINLQFRTALKTSTVTISAIFDNVHFNILFFSQNPRNYFLDSYLPLGAFTVT
jgi:hypothetical protein